MKNRKIKNNISQDKNKKSCKATFDNKNTSDEETALEVKNYVKKLGLQCSQVKFCSKPNDVKKFTKKKNRNTYVKDCQINENEKKPNVKYKIKKKKNKFRIQDDEVSSTVPDSKLEMHELPCEKLQEKLLIKPGIKWFQHNLYNCEKRTVEEYKLGETEALKSFAYHLLTKDCELYRKGKSMKSDFAWIHTVLKNGTLADKVSAYTLLIQDSPVHSLSSIDSLVAMINVKGKRECLMAIDTLKDLFLSDLLLEDKKLRKFHQHPLAYLDKLVSGNEEARRKLLILWYFEDQLKESYYKFVKALEMLTHDPVEKVQHKAIAVLGDLLINNPEQEQYLLETLVNKLGHPVKSVAARVCHLLGQLVSQHPNIKTVVVLETERLLYRQNISPRAQYYALCFLNQLLLSPEDSALASRLIRIYFGFFKACTKTGEVENKMMSALLTGVNRAYPFIKGEKSTLMQQMDTLYQVVHLVSFNISIQALMLLFQVQDSDETLSDRFYVALYKKILDPGLSHSTRQTMFLNLIYRALKRDHAVQRIKAFIKRLFQICQYQNSGLVCGTLILVSHLLKQHPNLLNSKETNPEYDDDDDEHYEDVLSEEENTASNKNNSGSNVNKNNNTSWFHRNNLDQGHCRLNSYNPHHRNPLYAAAEYSIPWELTLLKKHYHPSVSVFSQQIISGKSIEYDGDPLNDFTLIRFLDKFVYRNPKKIKQNYHKNERQKVFGHLCHIKHSDTNAELLNKQKNQINPEEMYLHQYLLYHNNEKDTKDEDSDLESVNSEDFENLLDKFEPRIKMNTLDFAADVSNQKQIKDKKRKRNISDEEEEEEEQEDNYDDDEDIDFSEDSEFNNAFEEYQSDLEEINAENIEFNEEDNCMEAEKLKSIKQFKNVKKKQKSVEEAGIFASAEEFSNLLEENISNVDGISTQALSNKDKSHEKQLKWEVARDKWIKNADWKTRKHKIKSFSGKFKCQKSHKKNVHRK